METKVLRDIGFTGGEIKAYLALLNLGSTTIGPLVGESGISRSKIYDVLKRLTQKGLVSYVIKQKTKYFQAAEPWAIKDYLDNREREFKRQKEEADKLIVKLELVLKEAPKIKEAQVYESFGGIKTVHEHTYLKLNKGEEYFYLGIPAFQEEKYHLYWQRDHLRRVKAGIGCRLLFNQGTDPNILKNRNKYKYCDARYIPIQIETPAWIMGYKDVTVIGLQTEKGLAIEIINKEISDSFKRYFEAFWTMSKKL